MEIRKKWIKRFVICTGFMLAMNVALYMVIFGFINITDMVMWLLHIIGAL